MESEWIKVPYPVSTNVSHLKNKKRVYLNPKVKVFREEVRVATRECPKFGPRKLSIQIELVPGDMRRRDIDNGAKQVLDALQHAQVFDDDSQVYILRIIKCDPDKEKEGCYIKIWSLDYSLDD